MPNFGTGATDPWRFEEDARKMFTKYSLLIVPTWVIDLALGTGPLPDRPADILRLWPSQAPVERLRRTWFNLMIERLTTGNITAYANQ
jgi:hypothetical protein